MFQRKDPNAIIFKPDAELREAILNYHNAINPNGNVVDTIIELLEQALSSDATSVATQSARRQAYHVTLGFMRAKMAEAMRKLAIDVEVATDDELSN